MAGVFISYRRDDSAGFAGALKRELASRLGPERVFLDIKDIDGGTEFPVALDEAIKSSEVVLVLIGSRWLDAKDGQGMRRLENTDDFVRQEVARSLAGRARVIPLLLDGTQLPASYQLPVDLQPLTTRQALELRNSHWDEDFARLLNNIREGIFSLEIEESAEKRIGQDFNPIAPSSTGLKVLFCAVIAMGVIFAAIGLGSFISQLQFLAHATRVDARVVNLLRETTDQGEATYYPQLEYVTTAGDTVHVTLKVGSNPPEYEVGQHVAILVSRKEPGTAITDSFWGRWLFAVIFGGAGLTICASGAVPFALRVRRRRGMERLMKEGKPILTAFHSVEENTVVDVNGRHPFYVITRWRNPVSHELVQFRSPALWEDPTVKASNQMITVVVDPNNFHHYLMDLSFLYRAVGPALRRL
jgi:hypothetical protein